MPENGSPEKWAEALEQFQPCKWDDLPDLDLYMDQVITLLTRELDPFAVEADKPLTSNMINNYVKDGVLPRPDKKKYNREHFAKLIILCQLKSVLSIPEIDLLLRILSEHDTPGEFFDRFVDLRKKLGDQMAQQVQDLSTEEEEAHRMEFALHFALTASLYRCAAAHLIAEGKAKEEAEKQPES